MLFKNVNVDGLNISTVKPATKPRQSLSCCTVSPRRHTSIAI